MAKEGVMRLSMVVAGGLVALLAMSVATAEPLAKVLKKQCGAARMTIHCAPNSTDCKQTTLTFKPAEGRARVVDKPKGLGGYTAVGLACASAPDHSQYFVVQYGERPYGCAFCEWYHIYSKDGTLLTHSDPAILTDTALPPAQQQHPNNKEYNELSKRLELDEQEIELFR
jgi:hypothetical protein